LFFFFGASLPKKKNHHRTRKVVCGPTEEQARLNLRRVRGTAPER